MQNFITFVTLENYKFLFLYYKKNTIQIVSLNYTSNWILLDTNAILKTLPSFNFVK